MSQQREPAECEYTVGEEIAHAVSHGLGILLSIGGLVVLVAYSALYGDAWHVVSTSIYGSTLVLLYTPSTLYHGIPHARAKSVLQRLDHAAIFLLIAGTYTPFTLVNLRGDWGWTLFGLVWGIAIAGVVLELACKRRYERLSIGLYLGLVAGGDRHQADAGAGRDRRSAAVVGGGALLLPGGDLLRLGAAQL